jgi:hypothetical protein
MNRSVSRCALAVLVPGCVFAACLSSSPPAPAVRFFDATPEARATVAADHAVRLRFTGAPHLGREFAVRVAPRELVFDPLHSWIAEPVLLVEAAFASPPAAASGNVVEVHVAAFELDLSSVDAVARVRLELRAAGRPPQVVEGTAPAPSRAPEAVAAAMAAALGQAAGAAAGKL